MPQISTFYDAIGRPFGLLFPWHGVFLQQWRCFFQRDLDFLLLAGSSLSLLCMILCHPCWTWSKSTLARGDDGSSRS
ncbi:hypothetical protein B0H63DRAFT_476066 [Podospora didyma]|uniref:Uncharacterized protein n=1 Tax=Podospora didyma TaxID=330526 RepID=A0AAE0NHI3_9PEZI|nr:hypothetical protein B0H63DRAFT_476066 [Podospora didyma]